MGKKCSNARDECGAICVSSFDRAVRVIVCVYRIN